MDTPSNLQLQLCISPESIVEWLEQEAIDEHIDNMERKGDESVDSYFEQREQQMEDTTNPYYYE